MQVSDSRSGLFPRDKTKFTNDLYRTIKNNPELAQDIQDRFDLSEAESRENLSARNDALLKASEGKKGDIGFALIGGLAVALGTVAMGGVGAGIMLATYTAGISVITGLGGELLEYVHRPDFSDDQSCLRALNNEVDAISGVDKLAVRAKAVENVFSNEHLIAKLQATDDWRVEPPAKDEDASGTPLSAVAKGVINTVRTSPKWVALPLVNTIVPPRNSTEEVRNEKFAAIGTAAAVTVALAPFAAVGTLAAAALVGLGSKALTAGYLNVGRMSQEEAREKGVGGGLGELAIGYKNAVSSAFAQGKDRGFVNTFTR